jgi:hypothetical protein
MTEGELRDIEISSTYDLRANLNRLVVEVRRLEELRVMLIEERDAWKAKAQGVKR